MPLLHSDKNKFKSIKFLFTFLALFYYQSNYSIVDASVSADETKDKSEHKYNAKEKKLKNFELSVNDETTLEGFSFHEKSYTVNYPIEIVWNTYESVRPNECWSGPLVTYKKSYLNSIFHNFKEEIYPPINEGTIYLIKIKILPLIKIPVVFQLTKLDRSEKIIELTYGRDNTSHGKQTIRFIADGDKTLIKHTSYFKSQSNYRDKHLYPKYHEKFIDEFHANIQNKLNATTIITNAAEKEKSPSLVNN